MPKSIQYETLCDILTSLNHQIDSLRKRQDQYEQTLIKFHSPHTIGEVVKCNQYSYEGRDMLIESISLARYMGMTSPGPIDKAWRYTGRILKKNKQPSKMIGERIEPMRDI